MEVSLTICVITYKRLRKWNNILRNLSEVSKRCPSDINLKFLFIEDSKSPEYIWYIKNILASLILKDIDYTYITGKSNLGSSRNYAFEIANTDWIGFIDDDDYYDVDILNELHEPLTKSGSLSPDVINFGMTGNFKVQIPIYKGYPEPKNRLRKFDDPKFMACVPSSASFYRVNTFRLLGLKYRNGNFEDASTNMLYTYLAPVAYHYGKELMFRDRAKNSIVNGLSRYSELDMYAILKFHVRNLYKGVNHNVIKFGYLYDIFKYNFGNYVMSHGYSHNVWKLFYNIEFYKSYKDED